jgi:hypothetical protein
MPLPASSLTDPDTEVSCASAPSDEKSSAHATEAAFMLLYSLFMIIELVKMI